MGEQITIQKAAKLLRKSERSVRRLVERGELERDDDGFFDAEEIAAYIKENDPDLDPEDHEKLGRAAEISALSGALEVATRHTEKVFTLAINSQKDAMSALTESNRQLLARDKEREDTHITMMSTLGEVLLRKSETESNEKIAQARTEQLAKMGDAVTSQIPMLVGQIGGRRKAQELLAHMSDAEKEALPAMSEFFSSPKAKKAFVEFLATLGIKAPEKKEEAAE